MTFNLWPLLQGQILVVKFVTGMGSITCCLLLLQCHLLLLHFKFSNLLLLHCHLLLSITLHRLVSKDKVRFFFLNHWQSNALSIWIYKTTQKL